MLLLRSFYIIREQKELLLKTLIGINAMLHKFDDLVKFALHSMLKFCTFQL